MCVCVCVHVRVWGGLILEPIMVANCSWHCPFPSSPLPLLDGCEVNESGAPRWRNAGAAVQMPAQGPLAPQPEGGGGRQRERDLRRVSRVNRHGGEQNWHHVADVCVCLCCVCVCVCILKCHMRTHMSAQTHTHMRANTHIHTCVYTHTHAYAHART